MMMLMNMLLETTQELGTQKWENEKLSNENARLKADSIRNRQRAEEAEHLLDQVRSLLASSCQ